MTPLIPSRKELGDVARLREGTLREHPFPVLLQALAAEERTVVLEIRRRQLHKRIVVEQGVPVDCRSNLVHETLGRFLVNIGRITEEQFAATFAEAQARDVRLGEILTERGLIGPYELYKDLQQNLAKKLLDGFSWRDGDFRMLFDVPEVQSPLKVRVPQLIVFGITRFSLQEEADAAAGMLVGKPLMLNPEAAVALEDIRLSPNQAKLTACLGPGRRIDELAEASGLPYEDVTRLLYALVLLEVVLPADQVRRRPAPPPVAVSPVAAAAPPTTYVLASPGIADRIERPVAPSPAAAPTAATAATAAPAEIERRRNELMQAYLVYRQKDAFDLLELPEDATPALVQQRYLHAARRWAFWTWPPELMPVSDKAQDLFLAAARAYAQLSDTEQRNGLLFRRRTLREERSRRPPADLTIKTDLLDSELQYRRGRMHLDAGRFKDALQLLEFAADCDPQNGLYRAELGWCRFQHQPQLPKNALRDLLEACRIDPRCGIAWFYAGEVHQAAGDLVAAEASYQKAIKLMAPDRRPIEALRTLSTKKR